MKGNKSLVTNKDIKERINDPLYKTLNHSAFSKKLADELGVEWTDYLRVKVSRYRRKHSAAPIKDVTDDKTTWHEEDGSAQWNYNGTKSIQTLRS